MITYDELLRKEEGFENLMLTEVEPHLETLCERGSFDSVDGTKIAYRKYVNPNAKANIMIVHGFSEPSEKYNEMIYVYYENGYSVFISDLRGHGDSGRSVSDPALVDVKSFNRYVEDIKTFYDLTIKDSKLPNYLFGQSMGGAISILYTEKHPKDFAKAVYASPMIRMKTGKFPFALVRIVSRLEKIIGNGYKYAAGQHPFNPTSHLERSSCKSPERYEYIMNKRRAEVKNQTWGGSYNWVVAATRCSAYIIREKNIRKINIPTLFMRAGQDHMVESEYIKLFADKVKGSSYSFFEESRHEIYHGFEDERIRFYKEVLDFYNK